MRAFLATTAPFIHAVAYLTPKRRDLVCCSEWLGCIRSDNAYAFYVYMTQNSKLDVVWLYRNTVKPDFRTDKSKFVYLYSLKGLWLQLRSGTFVYSNGKSDFIRPLVTSRSLRINLWHGIPIKKVYYAAKQDHQSAVKFRMVELRNAVLPYLSERPDYILSHNKKFHHIMHKSFLPYKGIITGRLPRWDVFRPIDMPSANTHDVVGSPHRKTLIYCPTFRDYDHNYTPLNDVDLVKLDQRLGQLGMKLFVKFHPVTPNHLDLSACLNIQYMPNDRDVLGFAIQTGAGLVSDVSSLVVDALNLSIPVAIFFPDLDSYLETARATNIDYKTLIYDVNYKDFFVLLDDINKSAMWSVPVDRWGIFVADHVEIWDQVHAIIAKP